jgi:histidine triad (HIT) family protein
MSAYDPQNIFAKILRGEIPCHKIYEDEHTLAFMDIMPQCDGHCLVVPKVPSRGLLDTDPAMLSNTIAAVQKVARAAVKAFEADGFQIVQRNGSAAGQTIFHLHFNILPLKEGVPLKSHSGAMADHEVLAKGADAIRSHL